MHGWIKLHRCLLEKAIWQCSTPEQKTILITLLMMANHEENEWEWEGQKYKCKPGQFITSLKSIAEKAGLGISIQNVRTALTKFEKYGFLTNQSTNKNRLITIVNWDFYQAKEDAVNKPANKQLTSSQQATNKQLTTNKNDKNDKNDKKYSDAAIEVANYLKAILKDKGVALPRNWHLKNYACAESLLKTYSKDELIAAIDWGLANSFWSKQIDSMMTIERLMVKYQLSKGGGLHATGQNSEVDVIDFSRFRAPGFK